ncbi:ATP-dependent RNA helicase glh-2-like [Watersipora subatra]|uniref:ATP-dependent RNA helicase glh-2-like n=1 Tax=Watersipora subatra TaxID=2589382 RepID=UPI00355B8B36
MGFGESEELRERFSVALAVNGLSDSSTRMQLLQESDLSWKNLASKLKARHLARESESVLTEMKAGRFNATSSVSKVDADKCAYASGLGASNSSDAGAYSVSARPRKGSSGYGSHQQSRDRYHKYDYRPGYKSRDSSRSSVESNGSDMNRGQYYDRYGEGKRSSFSKYRSRDSSASSNGRRGGNDSRRSPSPRYYMRSSSPARHGRTCYHCKREGHKVRNCPDAHCFTCNTQRHTSKDCPDRQRSSPQRQGFLGGRNRSPGRRYPSPHRYGYRG